MHKNQGKIPEYYNEAHLAGKIRKRLLVCAALWILLISAFGYWYYTSRIDARKQDAVEQARLLYKLQLANLKWASEMNGIFVNNGICPIPGSGLLSTGEIIELENPTSDQSSANNKNKRKFSLKFIAPPAVSKQLQEIHEQLTGVRCELVPNYKHANSGKIIDEISSADQIAREGLHKINSDEYYIFTEEDGIPVLKFVKPIPPDASCSTCHSKDDADLKHASSNMHITMPLNKLSKVSSEHLLATFTAHISVVLIGLAILFAGYKQYISSLHNRAEDEKNLSISSVISEIDSIPDGVIITDQHGFISHINPASKQFLPTRSNVLGKKASEVLPLIDIKTREEILDVKLKQFIETKRETAAVLTALKEDENSDDSQPDIVSLTIAPAEENLGLAMSVKIVLRKITNLGEFDKQIAQAQKLNSIGLMTGSIVHDFNNLLTAITGNAELLDSKLKANAELKSYCDEIISSADRAADLTKNLLSYSRKDTGEKVELNIHELLDQIISIVKHVKKKDVTVVTNFRANDYKILGVQSLVQSALLNICLNACDAMPNGGNLAIDTENICENTVENNDAPSENKSVEPVNFIKISISDTGHGIEPENIQRIFEPFFTTKDSDRGTGLGLANVANYVAKQGGKVTVDSKINEGTTLAIFFRLIAQQGDA